MTTDQVIPQWTMGDRLRKARHLTGLDTRAFAELIGISQKSVTNAEGDHVKARRITINAWALATGVPVQWLLEGDVVRHQGLEPRTRWLTTRPAA
jgi:transcriptional regulator with XRE-family HTH domain